MDNADNLDEKTMLLEQDRLAREKKKKKNRKKRIIVVVLVVVLAAGGIWYGIWGRRLTAVDSQTTVKITAEEGQEIIFAKLSSVKGNEITYTIAEEAGNIADIEERGSKRGGTSTGELSEGGRAEGMGEVPTGERSEGGRAEGMGEAFTGERSEGGKPEGMGEVSMGEKTEREKPEGMDRASMGERSEGGMSFQNSAADTFTYENVTYRLTEKTVIAQIPVGTEVTTKLGTVTTFSRLAAGDYVALVVETSGEEQTIVAVYIVG